MNGCTRTNLFSFHVKLNFKKHATHTHTHIHTYLHVMMMVMMMMVPHNERMVAQVYVRVFVRHRVPGRYTCRIEMGRSAGWRLAWQEVLNFSFVSVDEKRDVKDRINNTVKPKKHSSLRVPSPTEEIELINVHDEAWVYCAVAWRGSNISLGTVAPRQPKKSAFQNRPQEPREHYYCI